MLCGAVGTFEQYKIFQRRSIPSNPIQSNPIQSNPIQSNPIQSNPIQCACEWQPEVNVFNLGFPKGGSSTLHRLMKQFGCKSSHQGVAKNTTRLKEANVSASGNSANLMKKAYWEEKPLLHFIDDSVNAFMQMDWDVPPNHVFPQLEYYEVLQQQYPKSKFILMKRNITDHIRSINNWGTLRHRMRDFDLPYLPKGKGTTDQEMRIWIEGHYDRVTRYFEAVAPDQFIVVRLEDAPVDAIAEFLGCRGNYTMPHANANPRSKSI